MSESTNGYNRHIRNAPVVLFLGAGASADLEKPLMAKFLSRIEDQIPDGEARELLNCVRKSREDDLEGVLEDIQGMDSLSYLTGFTAQTVDVDATARQRASQFTPGEVKPPPIEQPPITKEAAFGQPAVKILLSKLHRGIIDEYGHVPTNLVTPLFDPLMAKLFTGIPKATLPVFTTNYDPAIEEFCEAKTDKFRLVDGFSPKRLGSNRQIWQRATFDNYVPELGRSNVVLFKMHGSANWAKDPNGEIHTTPPVYMERQRFDNAVIYPATRKVAFDEPYSTAYDYFQRCCERAGLCIVIGYSFRDYDALTRLQNAARLNQALTVLLVSPDATPLIKKTLAGIRCQPVDTTFARLGPRLPDIEKAIRAAHADIEARSNTI